MHCGTASGETVKDPQDKTTGELLEELARIRKSNAARQSELKARRIEQGFKRTYVWLHQESESAGAAAASAGEACDPMNAGTADPLSWAVGWVREKQK